MNQTGAQGGQAHAKNSEMMVQAKRGGPSTLGGVLSENVDYNTVSVDTNGNSSQAEGVHKIELREKLLYQTGKNRLDYCKSAGQCVQGQTDRLSDQMTVAGKDTHGVEKRFFVDDQKVKIYDPTTKKGYDFVQVDASVKNGFVFTYKNDPPK